MDQSVPDLTKRQRAVSQLCFVASPTPLAQESRARMVAALRVVDYVLIADELEPDALLEALRPQTVIHLEADDARRNREIAERIRGRQA